MSSIPVNVHGTAISIAGHGVLIIGASGSGKSDLALRLIDRGAIIISDDRVIVEPINGHPVLRTAPNIEGKIEVRGVAIITMPFVTDIELRLVIDLAAAVPRFIETMSSHKIAGFAVPSIALAAFEASAVIKVEKAIKSVVDQAGALMAKPLSQSESKDDAK